MKRFYFTLLAVLAVLTMSASAPNGSGTYYRAANGKKGAALKSALRDIVQTTVERSYDDLWTDFKTTDKRSDGKVWDMYSSITNFTFGTDQAGSYHGEGDVYNREHSFPKSWFGGEIKPMYTDLHHMYPTDGYVNNRRGNLPFGTTNGETYKSAGGFSKVGACTYSGYTGEVFEPNDEYKGDLARTYFYMVTRYEEKLADWYNNNSEARATLNGTAYPAFQTWQLNMLMEWAAADPVSPKEVARNNAVYGKQLNRNPFIDYPGLEQYIWGNKKDVAFSYDNYDGSGSGSGTGGDDPDPGTDPGTGTESGADVIDLAFTGVTSGSSSYADWSNKKGSASSAVYSGNSAGSYGSVQLRGKSNSGIISTTSGGTLTKVKVTWNSNTVGGRTLDVYGKHTAYTAVSDLYSTLSSMQGTLLGSIVEGTSTELTIDGSYEYVGLRCADGAMFLDKIEIVWGEGGDAPTPVASDLALDASSLSFDLYGDSGAKTIRYTSSGTGAVTVSGGEGFVTTSVDAGTKTISVTPTAVTPSPQTITVSQAADALREAGSATFSVTVANTAPIAGASYFTKITSMNDFEDGGTYLIVYEAGSKAFDGSLTSLDAVSNNISVAIEDNKIEATSDVLASAFTIASKSGGYSIKSASGYYIGRTEKKNGLNSSKSDSYVNEIDINRVTGHAYISSSSAYLYFNSDVTQSRFRYYTSNQKDIQLYKYVAPAVPSAQLVSVGDTGYATMVAEADLTIPAEVEVFAVQVSADASMAHLELVSGILPKDEAVVVRAEKGTYSFAYADGQASAIERNDLLPAMADVTADGSQYCLSCKSQGTGFYKVSSGVTIPKGKAYLLLSGSYAKPASILLEDEALSVSEEIGATDEALAVYNLAGQQVRDGKSPKRNLPKGIYVVGGRKVLK